MLNRAVWWSSPVWLCLASAAPAEIVIDHQPYNTGGPGGDTSFVEVFSPLTAQLSADEFILDMPVTIRHVTWWGFYGSTFGSSAEQPPATQTMRIRVYDARVQDGLPGSVLFEKTIVDPPFAWTGRQVLTGPAPNEYKFDVDLTTPMHLVSSMPYWLEIVQLESPQSLYRWEISVSGRDGFAFLNDATGDWVHTQNTPANLAFQLSTIPEPTTAALFGIASMILIRHRRRWVLACQSVPSRDHATMSSAT